MASSDMSETPYALFGGYNSSQIVGGASGLQTFKNNPGNYKSNIRSWSMDTKDILYNGKSLQYQGQTKTYPAVIDTGSSFLAVPPEEYATLQDQWRADLKDLDCKTDETFCQVHKSCVDIAKKLKPVGFQIGDTVFELEPMSYLHQGEGICQFAIAQNPLDSHNNGNFIFGDLFLKHFYSIYDFDQELISLGVNTHSEGIVQMYPKGAQRKDLSNANHTAVAAQKTAIVDDGQNSDIKIVMQPKTEETSNKVQEIKSEKPSQEIKDPKPEKASDSAYETAAMSEKSTGKSAPNGIKSFSGKSIDEVVDDSDEDAEKQTK